MASLLTVLKVAGAAMTAVALPADPARGSLGARCWLRTGLPVSDSILSGSRNGIAAGDATTNTDQPSAWASSMSWPTSAAGAAPHTTTHRVRNRASLVVTAALTEPFRKQSPRLLL